VEIIPDKRRVVGFVGQSARGELCLPNFQRDFIWTRDEVADLILTSHRENADNRDRDETNRESRRTHWRKRLDHPMVRPPCASVVWAKFRRRTWASDKTSLEAS